MTNLIVTGAEQGLGAALLHNGKNYSNHWNITREVMEKGKSAIDEFMASITTDEPIHLINNYGTNHLSWIGQTEEDDERIIRTNVMLPYWVVNAAVKHKHSGRIINIASATYRVSQRCTSLYCASKAALVQMTKVMARELAADFIVNAVAPGLIANTEMAELTNAQVLELRGWDKKEADRYARDMIPLNRYTYCDEVSEAVFGLLAMPRYVTGTVLDVMGGV